MTKQDEFNSLIDNFVGSIPNPKKIQNGYLLADFVFNWLKSNNLSGVSNGPEEYFTKSEFLARLDKLERYVVYEYAYSLCKEIFSMVGDMEIKGIDRVNKIITTSEHNYSKYHLQILISKKRGKEIIYFYVKEENKLYGIIPTISCLIAENNTIINCNEQNVFHTTFGDIVSLLHKKKAFIQNLITEQL